MAGTINSDAMECISFMERFHSLVQVSELQPARSTHNLLSFLAILKSCHVPILAITWQTARDEVGFGGTSRVREFLANVQTSLAFKCISQAEKLEKSASSIFQMLINEITVLAHPVMRAHPNIAQLHGICWDVSDEGKVWPVLISEKSQYGDLRNFAAMPVWRTLDMSQKFEICVDIGTALLTMHSNKIVHGDLNPQNILIFKESGSELYTAKVIDFGYSTRYANDAQCIKMPISRPWNAPEHTRIAREWSPIEAQKLDIYSLALVFFWILFGEYLTETAISIDDHYNPIDRETKQPNYISSLTILQDLKNEGRLLQMAEHLIDDTTMLCTTKKPALRQFFGSALVSDPSQRNMEAGSCFNRQIPSHDELFETIDKVENNISDVDFKIEHSLLELYSSDYRVRSYIRDCLEERLDQHPETTLPESIHNIAFQLAICYKIGFGGTRDIDRSNLLLQRTTYDMIDVPSMFTARNNRVPDLKASVINVLVHLGHLDPSDLVALYAEHGLLEEAESRIFREEQGLELYVGKQNDLSLCLKATLASIYEHQGRREAELDMRIEVMALTQIVFGSEHQDHLVCVLNLAICLTEQGEEWEAEELFKDLIEIQSRISGPDHLRTQDVKKQLGELYRAQGRLREAESLVAEVMDSCKHALGIEHRKTLASVCKLAMVFLDQERGLEAEELLSQAVASSRAILGPWHPDTVTLLANLSRSYTAQGKFEEAEELQGRILQHYESTIGLNHPAVLNSILNLANTLYSQNRLEEAETWELKAVEISTKSFGLENSITLICQHDLTGTYLKQERYEDAKLLAKQTLEIRTKRMGQNHHLTLASMWMLQCAAWGQDNFDEALDIGMQVVENSTKVLGVEHPTVMGYMDTLILQLRSQQRMEDAERIHIQLIESQKKVFGVDHPETISSMDHLGLHYSDIERWEDAETLTVQLLDIRQSKFGEDHPYTISTLANLALNYSQQGKFREAENLALRIVDLRRKVLGEKHPDTILGMGDLARIHWRQQRCHEAIEGMDKVVEYEIEIEGPSHPHTVESMDLVKLWRASMIQVD